jgi:hypothetical protein
MSENKRNRYDYKDSLEIGDKAEMLFTKIAIQKGWKVIPAPSQSNINDHWDLLLEKGEKKFMIDVKAMKRLSRNDPQVQDEWLWIELHGVRIQDPGWLLAGKADLIAFEKKNSFLIVKRTDLIDLLPTLVDYHKTVNRAGDAQYKIYSRTNRPDKITLIETEKLKNIQCVEWFK